MLLQIKKQLNNLKGQKIIIYVDVGRNKKEIYEGIVLETYDNIWIFKTENIIKSFSYTDVLIKNVEISSC